MAKSLLRKHVYSITEVLRMDQQACCAIFGCHPMRFAWGFDEEDEACRRLKLELAQQIASLRQQGVSRFAVVADCGVGLYAGEIINVMREHDPDLMLFCVTPHEGQATKWAPYLRERYFDLLAKCSAMEAVSLHETAICEYEAYQRIINYAGMALLVYDPDTARKGIADMAADYAAERLLPLVLIHPDTFAVTWKEPKQLD